MSIRCRPFRLASVLAATAALSAGCAAHREMHDVHHHAGYTSDVTTVQVVSALVGGKNVFIPSTIVVTDGGPRSLSIVNTTEIPHGFAIAALGIERVLAPGECLHSRKEDPEVEGIDDLRALITGMGQSNTTAKRAYMFDNLNLPEIIDFLAAKIITADVDCCFKNYYLYRDSDGTGEWQAMRWDVDRSFGHVWTCGTPCLNYFDETIYTNQSITVGNGNTVFTPFYGTASTRQMFMRRLRTLTDQLLQPPGTPATNDLYRLKTLALRDQIPPDAALDMGRWGTWGTRETITQAVHRIWNEFLPGRRAFIFQTMSVTNGGEIPAQHRRAERNAGGRNARAQRKQLQRLRIAARYLDTHGVALRCHARLPWRWARRALA